MRTGTKVITRAEIYELVWSTPMTKVAEKSEVLGRYLARVCTELRVPRPERGYWAKLAVGKAPQRLAVPQPRPASSTRIPRLPRPVTGTHGLIRGAKEHFLASRKVADVEHLKP